MRSMLAFAFVAVGLVVSGCKSTGVDQAAKVANRIREIHAELDVGKTCVDEAMGATKIDPKGDLKAQFKNYVAKVDALEDQANRLRSLRTDVEKSRDEFVKSSDERRALIQNEGLRKKGEESSKKLVERFNELGKECDEGRSIYDAMMKDLRDAQLFLDGNLNAGGIDAVEDTMEDATKSGGKLKAQINDIQEELKQIADELDVPPPPPPPAPEADKTEKK